MGAHKQEYLHNVAASVMSQIHLVFAGQPNSDWYECEDEDFPKKVWDNYGDQIRKVLGRMGPSARGRIAACGSGLNSLDGNLCWWEVDQGAYLNLAQSGENVLTTLAAYVVIAAITDILRARVRKWRDEENELEHQLDLARTHTPRNTIPNSSKYPSSRR